MDKKIAFVEDDPVIRENYSEILSQAGFSVEAYSGREEATAAFQVALPDLALLDVSMGSERDAGFRLCADIRQIAPALPVVFLTSHDGEIDKISGMRLGADDYITKDASIDYIIVRLEALFRRLDTLRSREDQSHDRDSNLCLDKDCSQATWKGEKIDLPLTQYWMLEALVENIGATRSQNELMKAAKIVVEPNTIVAHVKAIRDAIKRIDSSFDCIKTERGLGYRWVEASG